MMYRVVQTQIIFCTLLYLSQFLLRMSSKLPSILLKLSLSMLASLTVVKVFTLACLHTSCIMANSPKQSPSLYLYTILGNSDCVSNFSATKLPSITIQNLFPCSPWLMTYCPASNLSNFSTSQNCSFSHTSIYENNSILSMVLLNVSLFLALAPLTTWLKVVRSREYSMPGVVAIIVAALGALYMRANSPNASPFWYVFKQVFTLLIFLQHSQLPDSTIYSASPASPSVIITSPFQYLFSSIAVTNASSSALSTFLNNIELRTRDLISSFTSSVLGTSFNFMSSFWLKLPNTQDEIPTLLCFFPLFLLFLIFSSTCARVRVSSQFSESEHSLTNLHLFEKSSSHF